jgi:osmoprotectant transport system ATP-binding protein
MNNGSDTPIEFHNVAYSLPHGGRTILHDLSFKVHRGETLVLLGESGCGKTTTLRLINRLLLPYERPCRG